MAKKQTDGNLALEQQRVIVIPAHDEIVARKLRVAAYARVSSSSEDQLNSYRVQNQYYSELISNNPDWEMVDIYADEGITGTSVEKREDFQRMMQDCRKGKIDRILVKSISRFARNTKDCLAAVRELKELGVSVQFEEQGIDTSKVSSEMVTATETPAPTHTNTQAELDDVLNTQPLDEDAARSLICKLAQEQYDTIGNEEYETVRLRRLFTAFECTAELNAELLQSTVSAVLVTRQVVRLQLKNGQIIGKEDLA